MPTCSFVIPALNEEEGIESLLRDLRRAYPEFELIVVDGGSSDDTVARAMPLCDLLLVEGPGRARQMNLGGAVARGDYLFFLHADTRPRIDVQRLLASLVLAPGWGFSRVRLSGSHPAFRLIESAMNLRSRLTRVATGDQLLFLDRNLFELSGGFASIPLMEDVEYCKRLRRYSRPLVLEEPVVTSSRRWEQSGIARTVLRMWGLRLAWFLGVSPERLLRFYYPGAGPAAQPGGLPLGRENGVPDR